MGGQTLKLESNKFNGIPRTVPLEVAVRGGFNSSPLPVRPNANTSLSIQRLDDILIHAGRRARAGAHTNHPQTGSRIAAPTVVQLLINLSIIAPSWQAEIDT